MDRGRPARDSGQSVGHLELWKSLVVAQVQLGDESARVVEGADVKFDQRAKLTAIPFPRQRCPAFPVKGTSHTR